MHFALITYTVSQLLFIYLFIFLNWDSIAIKGIAPFYCYCLIRNVCSGMLSCPKLKSFKWYNCSTLCYHHHTFLPLLPPFQTWPKFFIDVLEEWNSHSVLYSRVCGFYLLIIVMLMWQKVANCCLIYSNFGFGFTVFSLHIYPWWPVHTHTNFAWLRSITGSRHAVDQWGQREKPSWFQTPPMAALLCCVQPMNGRETLWLFYLAAFTTQCDLQLTRCLSALKMSCYLDRPHFHMQAMVMGSTVCPFFT